MLHFIRRYPAHALKLYNSSRKPTNIFQPFTPRYHQPTPGFRAYTLFSTSGTITTGELKYVTLTFKDFTSFEKNCARRSSLRLPNKELRHQPFCTYPGSDSDSDMAENKYMVGYAKLGTSSCKKCKQKIDKGALRIAKLVSNPFSDDAGEMKQWFHPQCIFESFQRARATTKKIEEPDDVEGFTDLQQEDKDRILKLIKGTLQSPFAQWLSGRVLDSRPRDCGFEPHRHHCIVSLSKTHLS